MNDLINRQDAIDAVEFGITHAFAFNKETGESKELFKESNDELLKAIDRIKTLPSAQSDMPVVDTEDLIVRGDAIEAVNKRIKQIGYDNDPYVLSIRQAVADVSPAQTAQHGKWIAKDGRWHCSVCDGVAPKGYRYNFCPDCGTKMKQGAP